MVSDQDHVQMTIQDIWKIMGYRIMKVILNMSLTLEQSPHKDQPPILISYGNVSFRLIVDITYRSTTDNRILATKECICPVNYCTDFNTATVSYTTGITKSM